MVHKIEDLRRSSSIMTGYYENWEAMLKPLSYEKSSRPYFCES